jgi:hypothetical protein
LVIREMESLEPLFKQISGNSEEEWTSWWNGMMEDLLEDNGCAAGECLEVGNWWVKKPEKDTSFMDLCPL